MISFELIESHRVIMALNISFSLRIGAHNFAVLESDWQVPIL